MQRLEGAVIPMEVNSKINFVVGSEEIMKEISRCKPLLIFSELAIEGLSALSRTLLKNTDSRKYPDVMTFAFWCRKASISEQKKRYKGEEFRLGRGMVFHVAPSNVPLNFAYSFVASLLAGNASAVRLPSRLYIQTEIVCQAMRDVLEKMPELRPYVLFVRYGHEKEINDYLSSSCNVRVVWGGDETIGRLRQSPLSPRASEITLADRYSLAVIQGDRYLEMQAKERLARDFYNDTYYTDQNACTSPCLVFWLGERQEEARAVFWDHLRTLVEKEYRLQPVQSVDKHLHLCLLTGRFQSKIVREKDNLITRINVYDLDEGLIKYRGNSGFFMEYSARTLDELASLCGERCQTISYYGIDKDVWEDYLKRNVPHGADRIVPIGTTLDFKLVWDGVDFIRMMSREIEIR